jgi:hypothetical protein
MTAVDVAPVSNRWVWHRFPTGAGLEAVSERRFFVPRRTVFLFIERPSSTQSVVVGRV